MFKKLLNGKIFSDDIPVNIQLVQFSKLSTGAKTKKL